MTPGPHIVAVVTVLVLLASIPVHRTAAGDKPEELIVMANRVPTPASFVGSSVSVIDGEMLVRRQSSFVTDVLRDVPGVATSRSGTFGSQTQIRVRGAEANHLLVFIDGIKVTDPTASDQYPFAQLNAFDLERIEFVRGPQSSLWGSEAIAGVVNIVTRQTSEGRNAELFLDGGAFQTYSAGARAGRAWDSGSADVSGSYYDTDGENTSRSGSEEDGYRNATVTFNGSYDPRDDISLSLFARHVASTVEFDDDSVTGVPTDADLETDISLSYLRAGGVISAGHWEHALRFTWAGSERDNIENGAAANSQEGDRYGAYYQSSIGWGDVTGDSRANELILAADYEREEFMQHDPLFSANNQDEDRDVIGYVAQYLAEPMETLTISASVRHDDNSDFDNVTTWRISGAYTITSSGTRLHSSLGTGHKAPTFTELFGFFPEVFSFRGNEDLKPEESIGWDFGVEQSFADGRFVADLTYFSDKLKDEISTAFDFDPVTSAFFSTPVNLDGNSRRKGLEASVSAAATGALAISASYTYTDTRQPESQAGQVREIRRPRETAAINADYEFREKRAGLNLNVSYTGQQDDSFFDPVTFMPGSVELSDYWLVNLAGRIALSERLELRARVENMFDEEYEDVFGYRNPGIGAYAGVRINFLP